MSMFIDCIRKAVESGDDVRVDVRADLKIVVFRLSGSQYICLDVPFDVNTPSMSVFDDGMKRLIEQVQ